QPPRDVPQAAEQLPQRPAQLRREPPQQAPPLHQLHQDEGDLEQQVVHLPLLRVDAVDVLQVQAAVLLPVEPLVLNLPPNPPPALSPPANRVRQAKPSPSPPAVRSEPSRAASCQSLPSLSR